MNNWFSLDDIGYYFNLFEKFGYSRPDLHSTGVQTEQIDEFFLDSELDSEFNKDALHQIEFWLYKDKAGEVVNMIDHDPPDWRDRTGAWRVFQGRSDSSMALINLIKPNADRITAQILATPNNFSMIHSHPKDKETISRINFRKDNVLEENKFDMAWASAIEDAVRYGPGYFKINHINDVDSIDANRLIRDMTAGRELDEYELMELMRAIHKHEIEYVNPFSVVNYRNARGKEARSYDSPQHRWVHRVDLLPVSRAKLDYPDYAEQIVPGVNYYYREINPSWYADFNGDDSIITRFVHQIRFPVIKEYNIPGMPPQYMKGHVIAKITRLEGVGVVDIELDKYNHNQFDMVQVVANASSYHSKGIGYCKYGLDSQQIYNMFHNGILRYMGKQIKGGGFIDTRLGVSAGQLKRLSTPGEYVEVTVPQEFGEKSLRDFIVLNDPPQFPTSYSNMMAIESRAVDESMSVPDTMKGIQQGASGEQEDILRRQASMVHVTHEKMIHLSLYDIGTILFANIVQYDIHPMSFWHKDSTTGNDIVVELNKPVGMLPIFDEQSQSFTIKPSEVLHSVAGLQYKVHVTPQSIIPHDPIQKAEFYVGILKMLGEMSRDPKQLAIFRVMNDHVYNIEFISDLIMELEEKASQEMEAAMNNSQSQLDEEQAKSRAEMQMKKAELDLRKLEIDNKLATDTMKEITDKVPAIIPQLAQLVSSYMAQQQQQTVPTQ